MAVVVQALKLRDADVVGSGLQLACRLVAGRRFWGGTAPICQSPRVLPLGDKRQAAASSCAQTPGNEPRPPFSLHTAPTRPPLLATIPQSPNRCHRHAPLLNATGRAPSCDDAR